MTGPIVSITITPLGGQDRIELVVRRSGGSRLVLDLPAGTLNTARRMVPTVLRKFKDDLDASLGPATDLVRGSLLRLFMNTLVLGGTLSGEGPPGMEKLRALFVEALPDWESHQGVPVVQVEGPSYGFPFELLPVFETGNPGHMDDLEAFSRRFLGFSAAVRRVPYVPRDGAGLPAGQLLEGGPLPLSLAWYGQMRGARAEHQFFGRLAEHVELNGPWPQSSLAHETMLRILAEGLVDPRRRYDSAEPGRPVQIVHFACHCDTAFDSPLDYELELSGREDEGRRITLAELNMAYTFGQNDYQSTTRPLVFLNACGAAHQDPEHMYSWPEWFLKTGHRGVIGPETLVPDDTAAQYARFFYQALFAQRTVGEALVLARRELLRLFGNPLGLLYVLYGDPGITVDRRIPREVLNG